MLNTNKITDCILHTNVVDRRTALFENMWPLPQGVSYNSYIIKDEKNVLMDTVEGGNEHAFVEWVDNTLEGGSLDYLVIHHMELDHSGALDAIVKRYPDVTIIGNKKTFGVLEAYFGTEANLQEVLDGETLCIGKHTLRFVFTPWVHWPETMMTYELSSGCLFSGDAFGMFGGVDGGVFDDEVNFCDYESEMRRYYSNIVGKYSNMVQKAFAKLSGIEVRCICPLHGFVWRSNPQQVIDLYDKWSRYEAEEGVVLIYASMYGNTAETANYIARELSRGGVKNIRVHDVSKTHISYLINDIWKYKGVILGSCAYNAQMFPLMENLTRELLHMGVKNRYLGLFGGYSWNGGGVKNLCLFADQIGWEQVAEAVDIKGNPTPEKLSQCSVLAKNMADRVLGKC